MMRSDGPSKVLEPMLDYFLSGRGLPTPRAAKKKYAAISLALLGGLGYWGVVDKYNQAHNLSPFVATSNIISVAGVSSIFLVRSVDLALGLLNELAGVFPEELAQSLELSPKAVRQKIRRNTWISATASGLAFFALSIFNPLPFTKHWDLTSRLAINILFSILFGVLNIILHLLPFVILQMEKYIYYRKPFIKMKDCWLALQRCCSQSAREQQLFLKELTTLKTQLEHEKNTVRNLLADRIAASLQLCIQVKGTNIYAGILNDKNTTNIEKIIQSFKHFRPEDFKPAVLSPTCHLLSRILGSLLQLITGFTWWTMMPVIFFDLFQRVISPTFAFILAASLGLGPSLSIFVVLSFFGEEQQPRLINFIYQSVRGNLQAVVSQAANLNPAIFACLFASILCLLPFSSVNAKSVNEAQYSGQLPNLMMTFLNNVAEVGVPQLVFIATIDTILAYLTEKYAIFGLSGSQKQISSRLMINQVDIPQHIRKLKVPASIAEIKSLPHSRNQANTLFGKENSCDWLDERAAAIQTLEDKIATKEAQRPSKQSWLDFFHVPQCIQTCFRREGSDEGQPLLSMNS